MRTRNDGVAAPARRSLLRLAEPLQRFAHVTAVVEMRREDPEPAVFTVTRPVVLPVHLFTWSENNDIESTDALQAGRVTCKILILTNKISIMAADVSFMRHLAVLLQLLCCFRGVDDLTRTQTFMKG